jgi:hypothetical protein
MSGSLPWLKTVLDCGSHGGERTTTAAAATATAASADAHVFCAPASASKPVGAVGVAASRRGQVVLIGAAIGNALDLLIGVLEFALALIVLRHLWRFLSVADCSDRFLLAARNRPNRRRIC